MKLHSFANFIDYRPVPYEYAYGLVIIEVDFIVGMMMTDKLCIVAMNCICMQLFMYYRKKKTLKIINH